MEPKPSKVKGVTSSIHGSKRTKRASEEEQDDMSISSQSLKCYGSVGSRSKKGVDDPVLFVNERKARIDNMLSHLYNIQMPQLRMNGVFEKYLNMDYPMSEHLRALCRVAPEFEEPFDDDMAIEDEMARVDSDIESSDAEKKSSKMEKLLFPPLRTRIRGPWSSFTL
ncbi:hypothetical protein HAX54_048914 [Datura stramonium]|uniref:Uncharacterized protein n=1 Tax=Datura stramonium TaxID=4076 RepID=A0ABS8WJW2_DATST|nr:hypothetical protein [Datura stramonium]